MAYNLRSNSLDQQFLMPPSMREWLKPDHLVWTVIDIVSQLDLTALMKSLRADGRGGASYNPELLLSLVLYGYTQGERSSRQLEIKSQQDVAFRVASHGLSPDHATIARFVVKHQEAINELFSQLLSLCVKANLVDLSVLAVDGTKMAASASPSGQRPIAEVARQIIDQAIETDKQEDNLYGERTGNEVPAELRDPEWIKKALAELAEEREVQQTKGRGKSEGLINTTDPDSRMMRTKKGVIPAYNAQAVTTKDQIIVSQTVSQLPSDNHLLGTMSAIIKHFANNTA